jgi:hypothetical protein
MVLPLFICVSLRFMRAEMPGAIVDLIAVFPARA